VRNRIGVVHGRLTLAVLLLVAISGGIVQAAPPSTDLRFSSPVELSTDLLKEPSGIAPALAERVPTTPALSTEYPAEFEPNDTSATATPLGAGPYVQMQGNIFPVGDVDYFSFTANAGDRVYAAVITSATASASADSQLNLLDTDGVTVLEFDDNDGSFAATSSSIAGRALPVAGTYYLRVNQLASNNTIRPYFLHFRLQSGAPTPEVESNDTPATANPLPASGWVSGTRNPAAATEQDWYSFTANAGDTVFLNLDLDPERDNVQWDGRLGIALFGDAGNQILVVNDASVGSAANPLSEAMVFTVKTAGTYFAFVDSASAAVGGPTATYTLSVSVQGPPAPLANCTTYTSTDVPQTIPTGPGLISSTLTVPGNPRIADVNVEIQLNHAFMSDVDAHLRTPAGNDIGLFTDIGATAVGGQQQMDAIFDDEAAIPPSFTVLKSVVLKPEPQYRLSWLDGEDAGGTWTLDLRDDATADGGTLTGWSLRICEAPPPPTCAPGFVAQTVYSTDFESGAAGFTHAGTQDEWELGLPATLATTTTNPIAAFTTCSSGVNCWKTDLDNTYNASSAQDLLSPNINLAGLSAPIIVRWAQKYQMESASFDHYNVDLRQAGGATPIRLFEWLDGTMADAVGNPAVNIGESSGWSQMSARADALAGLNTELNFHVDSDNTINFGGVAIDDVSVTACRAASADLSITKTDGVTTAVPGGSVVYTITASNAGVDAAPAAQVADTFPATLTCTWTCVGAGGGTCTAAGAGNIADTANLPAGGSVTYTASCAIAASASGTLSNTATVSSGGIPDPNPGNDSATDSDTLTPQADVAITKTDGVTNATPGGSVTYTITSSNAGPSDAIGSNVNDTFPAALTCNWTCVGAGGGTCTAAGSGNIADVVNLPAGGSVTHTASCAISAAAVGTLSNTATVITPGGTTDPNPANNSATDADTLDAQADVSITKTDGVTNATPGGSVTYTITASNAGPSNAPGSTIADTFQADLTCTWTCAGAGGGTCTAAGSGNIADIANLPAGGSVTYTASCVVSGAASGTLINTATVASATTDPNPGNNSATDTDVIDAQADLAITKTDGVTSATPGGSTTYTIVATNSGPSAVVGANIADTFAASLTCTWTCVGAGGGTCTAAGAGNIADAINLPAGGSAAYTATCGISAAASGSLVNTATVASAIADPNPGNNSATDTDALGAQADVSITKTDGATSATPGGSTTYTIVATNSGPSAATGATVSDTFAASLTCTWTCVGAGGGTCTAAGSGNIADAANLPAGGSATYTASCNISASASGNLVNTATVAAPGGVTDPTPANNSATDTDTLGASADLAITKTDGVTSATPGGSTTYTIVATNSGPSGVTGATVSDSFASSLTCTWTCAAAGGGTCAASGSGNIADSVNLPSGASATYTASCAISASASGSLVNTATIAAPAGVTDPIAGNNSATDTDALGAEADLSITKSDGATTVAPGGTLTYSIVVGNAGPSAVTGAGVNDTFPSDCVAPTWTCAGTGGAVCPASGSGTIAANVDVPSGGVATFTATCPIGAGAANGTVVSNTATVAAPGGTTDPTPANNSATDTTTVVAAAAGANVTATKSASGNFVEGGSITYTIVLVNSGGAQADNPGDELVDGLPPQLGVTSAVATSGTAVANISTNTVTWNGAISSGGSVTITIAASILPGATGTISNQATVAYDGDGNGTNEASAVSDDPALPGGADPTSFVVAGAATVASVPTLVPVGLMLLVLGLMTMALRRVAQRRS